MKNNERKQKKTDMEGDCVKKERKIEEKKTPLALH